MFFHQRFVPGLAIYSYMVGDRRTKRCAVVDPTRDVDDFLEIARREGMRITDVCETHVHADFVSGARELKARLSGEPTIHCSAMGGDEWLPDYADRPVRDGDAVDLGGVRLVAFHTPGHTPEHMSWRVEGGEHETLLSGDFLFVGGVGRPDLLGEHARRELARKLHESLFGKLPALPDATEVYPGHGAGSLCGKSLGSSPFTTLGAERRTNESLREAPPDAWAERLLSDMPPAPPYFARLKRVNRKGPDVLGDDPPGRRALESRDVRSFLDAGAVVLDARAPEEFAAGHVPGAFNIPLAPALPNWAGWVLPYDVPVILVTPDAAATATHLLRIGLDGLAGCLDFAAWDGPHATLRALAPRELAERRGEFTVLDVRTDAEWREGHVEGALHVHGGLLPQRLHDIPRDRPVAAVCGSGYRSAVAASVLRRAGFRDVANVLGGMGAWRRAGLPEATM